MKIYQDSSRSAGERAADLVSRMTLEEKISQLGNQAPSVERLGVPAYNYWSEASHGYFGPFKYQPMDVTSYPVCLAMSQSWDVEKVEKVGGAISDECRALHNKNGIELHMWCPTINLARDPRNGRSDENFGEDPVLAGKLSAAYIRGMQGKDPKYLKTVSTPKHYALNSSENNRHKGSANVDESTLREYYTKVFKYAVREGRAGSIMTSYNRVNGVPASCNEKLLTTLLREEWGFDGFVVSDCGAVLDTYENPMFNGGEEPLSGHFYVKDPEEASAVTLKAGTDMTGGTEHKKYLKSAMDAGMISEDVIDRSLVRIFTSRFRLGLFEAPGTVPYDSIGDDQIAGEAQQALAVDIANDTIVLLKNENNLLPLNPQKIKSILVIGPNGIYRELGGYSAGSMSRVLDTPVNVLLPEAIRRELDGTGITVRYEKGWCTDKEFGAGGMMNVLPGAGTLGSGGLKEMVQDMFGENADMMSIATAFMSPDRHAPEDPDKCGNADLLWKRALEAAKECDVCIFLAGTDSATASEEHDRGTLDLPYGQNEKIKEVLAINDNTVVVLNTLGAVTGDFFEIAHTVLNAHFAGQEQGTAMANVLFGKVNPNAKLTATWYQSTEDLADINDYGIRRNDTLNGKPRTYWYLEKPPLFPFGYGLSYTEYDYSNLIIGKNVLDANDTLEICVDVTNTGAMDGSEIVQVYVSKLLPEGKRDNSPIRQLKTFDKVFLQAGETKTVRMTLPVHEISFWNNFQERMWVEPGKYRIEVGKNSEDIVCCGEISIEGDFRGGLQNVYLMSDKTILPVGGHAVCQLSVVREDVMHLSPSDYEVYYESSDGNIVTVDGQGMVTAIGQGVASVSARVYYESYVMTAESVFAVI